MTDYIAEYRSKDNAAVLRSHQALINQRGEVAEKRREAIAQVMEERGLKSNATREPIPGGMPLEVAAAARLFRLWTNAHNRGIMCILSVADMRELLARPTCYYTGMALDDSVHTSNPAARTLDRIDSSQGYTPDNVVACSSAANNLKNQALEQVGGQMHMTPEQLLAMAKTLISHYEKEQP